MEQADQTLHDFVLNLLSDAQAMDAFGQDPAAVLDHAGLSDISAADVNEVLPLVVDMAPQADALDGVLNQLPLDSLDDGQLGAIQHLQFITSALGGVPAFDLGGTMGNSEVNGLFHLTSDGQGGVWGLGELNTPLGDGAASVTGDIDNGLTATVWDATDAGSGTGSLNLPGLDAVPGLSGGLPLPGLAGGLPGLENLPGLDGLAGLAGGMPSGFSAMSDVTDALDGGSFANSTTAAASLLSGATEMATGALTNPGDLVNALSDPAATIAGLSSVMQSDAATAAQLLPSPAGDVAGQVVQVANGATSGMLDDVTSHMATGPLSTLTNALPTDEVSHALAPVQGILDQVTGNLNTGALSGVTGEVTSSLSDPTHALANVESTLSSVTGSATDSGVASHSVVSDITGSTGLSSVVGTTTDHTDASGLTGDLNHVTDLLHLPGL